MTKDATLSGGRRLNLTDFEHTEVSQGRTPKSIPKWLIVDRVEFHGNREHDGQQLTDYRVFFKDGTFDNVSITPAMPIPEMGKYYRRETGRGEFVTWED